MDGLYQLKSTKPLALSEDDDQPISIRNIAIGSLHNHELLISRDNSLLSNPNVTAVLAMEIYVGSRRTYDEIIVVAPANDDWTEFDVYRTYSINGKSVFKLTPKNKQLILEAMQNISRKHR